MPEDKELPLIPPDALGSNLRVPNQRRFRGARYERAYSNNVMLEYSRWDFSLTFGEIVDGHGDVHTIEELVEVTLPPLLAKVLAFVISNNVAAYEKQYGPLPDPVVAGRAGDGRQSAVFQTEPLKDGD